MENPKTILAEILGGGADLESLEKTGEPLDLLVEILRDIQKCRKIRLWLAERSGIDALVPPAVFHGLLSIEALNTMETANRNLDVEISRLNETRNPDDPVNAANFNSILREMYRDLSALNATLAAEYPDLILGAEISGDMVDRIESYTASLRSLNWKGVGYLFTGWKAAAIEKSFLTMCPNSSRAHPLRKNLRRVESELAFYRQCLDVNIKWAVSGMDLFRVIRENGLSLVLGNLEEMGNGIWNIVYNGLKLKDSLNLLGIRFEDARTFFDESLVSLSAESTDPQ